MKGDTASQVVMNIKGESKWQQKSKKIPNGGKRQLGLGSACLSCFSQVVGLVYYFRLLDLTAEPWTGVGCIR